MRERERQEAIKRREWIEAEERRIKEERERPFRNAEAAFQNTAQQLAQMEREAILNGVDPQVYVDPDTIGKTMSWEEAQTVAERDGWAFRERHPEFYPCAENVAAFAEYFSRNGLSILTFAIWEHAYERLKSANALVDWPEEPVSQETPAHEAQREEPIEDGYAGIDPDTGKSRIYSRVEVEKMSADQYRKAFRIPSAYDVLRQRDRELW